jgi:hypothetical protein
VQYELFADMEDGDSKSGSVEKTTVARAYAEDKAKLLFLFDYGDDWRFATERLGTGGKVKGMRCPRVVKSVGEAPQQYPDWEQ